MTTRFVGHPFAADNLVGVYPTMINGRAVLVFTNSGTRQAIWTTKAPQGLTGALSSPIPTRPTQVDDMAATEQNATIYAGDTVDLEFTILSGKKPTCFQPWDECPPAIAGIVAFLTLYICQKNNLVL